MSTKNILPKEDQNEQEENEEQENEKEEEQTNISTIDPSKQTAVPRNALVLRTDDIHLTRPARKQVKKGSGPVRQEITHHSSDYNIWYHKKLGDRFEKEERIKATTRCSIAKDSGYTRADINKKDTYFCLYFARGHCSNGSQCNFFHRIPTEEDDLKNDVAHDIFGRERHKTYRDDMGGVGSFMKENRTLHISGLQRGKVNEEVVTKHFAEWGQLEYVRVIRDKSIAFVRYHLRSCAEFAKEAMIDQSLDNNEILSLRWANEDSNPKNRQMEEMRKRAQIAKVVEAKRLQQEVVYQYSEQGQSGKTIDHFPPQNYPENAYPNTDIQYQTSNEGTQYVKDWLQALQLPNYSNILFAAGYCDWNALTQLDENALDNLGITIPDHRSLLLSGVTQLIQALNQSSTSQSYDPYMYVNPEYTDTSVSSSTESNDNSGAVATSSSSLSSLSSSSSSSKHTKSASLVAYADDDE